VLKVALTGGIATGKSGVRARVASRGVPTVDADTLVHELLSAGGEAAAEVVRRFGGRVRGADGAVDRRVLAALVFEDAEARRDLEAMLHPRVYARIEAWASRQARAGARWILADIPLLFETGHERDFDRVIATVCSPDEQVRRVMARDGCDEAAARARLRAQWPAATKAARATDVIDTGGEVEATNAQVDAICRKMDEEAGGRPSFGL
jgi:dephospho-CoA kinase